MRLKRHLRLLLIVTAAWILFWIAGLPDYYRQYSTATMIVFDFVILPPIVYFVYASIRKARPGRSLAVSLWMAFYISVPLFFYDLLYCGVYLGRGVRFIWEFWYLTVYYILPWLIFPPIGRRIDRRRLKGAVSGNVPKQ
jgi:hypothetical protein